ncbi:MAG: BatA domain-containing protein [Planctomycetaceae bacterium]|nr:BatA domain-containing protein [Planctomycetaceae bacterium]
MSFLSAAFLAALPLALAPLLLHLFDRRRNVVIEWGAMQFLQAAVVRRTSARRLKQWLLLLLRTLAVAALVLALARPILPGSWFGSRSYTETIFVLDNSMSMTRDRGVDGTSLFSSAVQYVLQQLDERANGDSVRLLLSSPYPVWATPGSIRIDDRTRQMLKSQLQQLQPNSGQSDLLASLLTAVQTERSPRQDRREIVVFYDGQSKDWRSDDEAGWKRLAAVLDQADIPTTVTTIDLHIVGSDESNLAIDRINSSRTIVGINQPLTFTARVTNCGTSTHPGTSAEWQLNGIAGQHESQIPALEAGESHDVHWTVSFPEIGVQSVTCHLGSRDVLSADDHSTLVVEVVNEVPIAVVETAADLAELQRDSFLVQAALGWLNAEPLDEHSVHVPHMVTLEQLERSDLADYQAVIIPNLTELTPTLVRQLEEFVHEGGGLWLAAGARTDVDAFNQLLFADGAGLSPLALDRIVSEVSATEDNADHRVLVSTIRPDHPATADLADRQRMDLSTVAVSRHFRFIPPPEGENAGTLLALSNGDSLAVEHLVGRGRVIVQTVPLRMQWSDLARSQSFVVLVQNWIAWLTQPQATRHNLLPGDPITVHLRGTEITDATLRMPQGDEVELTGDTVSDGVVFRSSRTSLPGHYVVELGVTAEQIPFYVSRPTEESHLTELTLQEREKIASVLTRPTIAGTTDAAPVGGHDPLWPLLLAILIALVTAELLVSGLISQERFGSTAISESADNWSEHSQETPFISDTQWTTFTQRSISGGTSERTPPAWSANSSVSVSQAAAASTTSDQESPSSQNQFQP